MVKFKRLAVLIVLAVFVMVVPSVGADSHGAKININTASAEELVKLKQIGPAYAERIIEYREAHGPFEKPEDIVNVTGIGVKTWELNKDVIVTE